MNPFSKIVFLLFLLPVSARAIENPFSGIVTSRDTVPEPRGVMLKSLRTPGWGQSVNKQKWKIPIIYGLFAGITVYGIYSDNRYKGYRAAYYNSFDTNTDQRFGATPSWIVPGLPPEIYRQNRNIFRNRRDMSFVYFALAYGLNVADAYIFAHLKDFDVSDDLSAGVGFDPDLFGIGVQPVFRVSIRF